MITPAGNWSSYPAHKHDEATETESELEEIYYFEIAAGPGGEPGFGLHADLVLARPGHRPLEEVHDRDTVLVPYGWHGPCVAAPGFDMYYLNVMAGPGAERAWKISDHPGPGLGARAPGADQRSTPDSPDRMRRVDQDSGVSGGDDLPGPSRTRSTSPSRRHW